MSDWPFVEGLIVRDEVESTSDLARELARDPRLRLPVAIQASRQTRGRGRGAHTWWSDAGSLTTTLILDPADHGLRPEHEPRIALAVAVAIAEVVAGYGRLGAPLRLRWPNDVEAGGKKLAGILPERVETPSPRVLIGIGVNVTTRLDDAPVEVRGMSTSLVELLAGQPDPGPTPSPTLTPRGFLRELLSRLGETIPRLAADDPTLAERWADLDGLRDVEVRVNLGPRVVSGVGRGIDPEGALLLDTGTELLRLFGGQVLRTP